MTTPDAVYGPPRHDCRHCGGSGYGAGRRKREPCPCTLRSAFRICLEQYRWAQVQIAQGASQLGVLRVPPSGLAYHRPLEGYVADFESVMRRALADAPLERAVFVTHCLQGVDGPACCDELGLDAGRFWHVLYRLEARLGRVLAEVRPYPLYPAWAYFDGECSVAVMEETDRRAAAVRVCELAFRAQRALPRPCLPAWRSARAPAGMAARTVGKAA